MLNFVIFIRKQFCIIDEICVIDQECAKIKKCTLTITYNLLWLVNFSMGSYTQSQILQLFCMLSQNCQHCFAKYQKVSNIVLINNSRITWPNEMLMLCWVSQTIQGYICILFSKNKKSIDKLKIIYIDHKTILLWGTSSAFSDKISHPF